MTCLSLLLRAASPFWTKMLGLRTLWIQDFCINDSYHIIFPIMNLCFSPPASTHPAMTYMTCVDNNSEHADDADNAITVPSSTSNSGQYHHARVAYPYVMHCATYSSTAAYVQQQTDGLVGTRTSLGKVNSSPRGDDFESDDDKKNNPA